MIVNFSEDWMYLSIILSNLLQYYDLSYLIESDENASIRPQGIENSSELHSYISCSNHNHLPVMYYKESNIA